MSHPQRYFPVEASVSPLCGIGDVEGQIGPPCESHREDNRAFDTSEGERCSKKLRRRAYWWPVWRRWMWRRPKTSGRGPTTPVEPISTAAPATRGLPHETTEADSISTAGPATAPAALRTTWVGRIFIRRPERRGASPATLAASATTDLRDHDFAARRITRVASTFGATRASLDQPCPDQAAAFVSIHLGSTR